MHELTIAERVVSTVLERTEGRQVSLVRLRIGRFSGVVPDALSFCFELATSGTPLEGAALEIEDVQGQARCRTCGVEFGLVDAFLLCDCGSADVGEGIGLSDPVEVAIPRAMEAVQILVRDRLPALTTSADQTTRGAS